MADIPLLREYGIKKRECRAKNAFDKCKTGNGGQRENGIPADVSGQRSFFEDQ